MCEVSAQNRRTGGAPPKPIMSDRPTLHARRISETGRLRAPEMRDIASDIRHC
jgi:hypothetical protein